MSYIKKKGNNTNINSNTVSDYNNQTMNNNDINNDTQTSYISPSILTIPPEIFAEISINLSPIDLISLSQVCNHLRSLLCSTSSQTTQAIWRASRLLFMPRLQMAPPDGMDEKSYIELNMLERGCQFCGHPDDTVKVIWVFRVRTCGVCLDGRTARYFDLAVKEDIPDHILAILPYTGNHADRLYWRDNVISAMQEYEKLTTEEDRHNWLVKKKLANVNRMSDATVREDALIEQEWNKNWRFIHSRMEIVLRKLQEQLNLLQDLAELSD
ncbi:1701_t:CDS:2 [Ambispora leptoticha]|uniref:1701_t:CDS:1 n=1 Tax=Ambispora leptoticha TaxID=144679 RepID=A0A9N9EQ05_9GLOM|nr:1701_t:CDS:2 [Ambispora leptoticha]